MSIDPNVKANWQELQSQYDYPVDAMGRPINPGDEETLRVWREEGIDGFVSS